MNNTEMLAPRLIGSSAWLERPALIVNKIKAFATETKSAQEIRDLADVMLTEKLNQSL